MGMKLERAWIEGGRKQNAEENPWI